MGIIRSFQIRVIVMLVIAGSLMSGCGRNSVSSRQQAVSTSATPSPPVAPSERPLAPEKNPPGDIPDSQVFITYTSTAGKYAVEAPEGWARSSQGANVKFTDKFDGEEVTLSKSATPPMVSSVQRDQVPALRQHGRAVKIQGVKTKAMPHGATAVYIVYTSNSDPDPVTGKRVRLDNAAYYYYHQGTLAALTLWAPSGADNVDQWKRISESFRWL